MKKIILTACILFLAVNAVFANAGTSEFNFKAAFDFAGTVYAKNSHWGIDESESAKFGVTLIAEALFPLGSFVKLGGGLEGNVPRKIDSDYFNTEFAMLPIYLTLKISPFSELEGLYLKGNVGYNALVYIDKAEKTWGSVYYGIGAGFTTTSGVIVEFMFKEYYSVADYYIPGVGVLEFDLTYSVFGLAIGYSF